VSLWFSANEKRTVQGIFHGVHLIQCPLSKYIKFDNDINI